MRVCVCVTQVLWWQLQDGADGSTGSGFDSGWTGSVLCVQKIEELNFSYSYGIYNNENYNAASDYLQVLLGKQASNL